MSSGAAYQGALAVEGGQHLPRGRHGIPSQVVVDNQRERLLRAATAIFAEKGYSALSVGDVTGRAQVSRSTFYKLFEDKLDCVLAAQSRALEGFDRTIQRACSAEQDWACAVDASVGAALDFAARFPADANLVLASGHAPSEPGLVRADLAVDRRLLERLRANASRSPSSRSPSDVSERAAVGAAISLVASCLSAGETEALGSLRPDIVQIVLAPYLGVNEARRLALNER